MAGDVKHPGSMVGAEGGGLRLGGGGRSSNQPLGSVSQTRYNLDQGFYVGL